MANLLSRKPAREAFPPLDPDQLTRFETRLETLVRTKACESFPRDFESRLDEFETQLDELESEASLPAALDLLAGIERLRLEVLASERPAEAPGVEVVSEPSEPPLGDLVCYWPGRSLATGEANLASRGFFDALDRPPVAFFVEAVARPTTPARDEFELVIIAWVPPGDLESARAGCRSCSSGSLRMLDDVSGGRLSRQLRPILEGGDASS